MFRPVEDLTAFMGDPPGLVAWMRTHPQQTNYAELEAAVTAAGYSMAQFAEVIGQGAYDVDDSQPMTQ